MVNQPADRSQKTPIALYAFEYKFIPTIIQSIQNKSNNFNDVLQRMSDKNWLIKILLHLNMVPGFDWNAFKADILEIGDDENVILYTFPYPYRMPLAKYGAVVVNEKNISYYTLELSERSNFSEALLEGAELKTEEAWVLGMTSIEEGHSNLGRTNDCSSSKEFIQLLQNKDLLKTSIISELKCSRENDDIAGKDREKYHITDEENVYQINDDGSVSEMVIAEEKYHISDIHEYIPKISNIRTSVIIMIASVTCFWLSLLFSQTGIIGNDNFTISMFSGVTFCADLIFMVISAYFCLTEGKKIENDLGNRVRILYLSGLLVGVFYSSIIIGGLFYVSIIHLPFYSFVLTATAIWPWCHSFRQIKKKLQSRKQITKQKPMGQIDNKNYHISDEGIIYRVNEDGSFTQLGDMVEFINYANENDRVSPKKATSRKRIMPYVIIICALTLGLYLFFSIGEMPAYMNFSGSADSASQVSSQPAVIDTVVEYQESPELQKKNSELKAENARLHQQIDILIEKNNNLRQRNETIANENDKLNQQVKNLLKQITL